MTITDNSFIVQTDPARTQRICTQIHTHLTKGTMSPDEAQRLSGKLTFVSEAMMSQTVICCIQPLYIAARQRPGTGHLQLTENTVADFAPFKTQSVPIPHRAKCGHICRCFLSGGRPPDLHQGRLGGHHIGCRRNKLDEEWMGLRGEDSCRSML